MNDHPIKGTATMNLITTTRATVSNIITIMMLTKTIIRIIVITTMTGVIDSDRHNDHAGGINIPH
eukprot:gnl/Chilomastix_caulleri/983.p2 GENE.gnl/Chilomastix_caulleri/983~~gnl/Chilomastix_caulleri/983.p2  ORF type:complete len:65 (+),score=18.43 gnl/Chilomastix_caulleri/983:265-459(+)